MLTTLLNIILALSMGLGHGNSTMLSTQAGYRIKAKVAGMGADTCFLGHYFGQYQYVVDTSVADSKGEVVFQGNEPLKGGIYFVVLPGKKFFEFIVNKEQEMFFETDTANLVKNMKVKGSNENRMFYEYLNFVNENQAKFNALKRRQEATKGIKDSTEKISREMEAIDGKVKDYKLNIMKTYPDLFMSVIFTASKDPDIPETPILPNGRKDSLFAYRYYFQHYWDNIDLSDDRILRTPIFYNKIKYYFDNLVIQSPDSIISAADKLVEKSRANKEVFKYVVWYITYTYETSKVMGFDAVFVHMVEKYYMTNQCFWMSATTLENITKRAMKIKPLLLGKSAPAMIMQDTSLQLVSLYNINAAYTVILFWDYTCGHCKTEIPKVVEFYNSKKKELGMEIFAVCTDTNMMEMKKFIRANHMNFINVNGPRSLTPHYAELYDIYSTPVIYLLDDKKAIIAKRIEIDQVEDIIHHNQKLKSKSK